MRNAGLLFDGREKVLDAFRGGIFPFKTTDTHVNDLNIILTPEHLTTASIVEHVSIKTKIIEFFNKSSNRKMDPKKRTKNITLKQLLRRLPILLAQVHAGNTSVSLLNEIRQIAYTLYRTKKNLKARIQQYK